MTQPRPITFLLDVDGVLNPFGAGFNPNRGIDGWVAHPLEGYKVWLNPNLGAALVALAAELGAQIMWATTWNERADELVAPRAGLPRGLPVLRMPDGSSTAPSAAAGIPAPGMLQATAKLPAVQAWADANPDHTIVWFDDDLLRDVTLWARERGNTILVRPSPKRGLLLKHLSDVRTALTAVGLR